VRDHEDSEKDDVALQDLTPFRDPIPFGQGANQSEVHSAMKKRNSMTAAEALAARLANPEFVAQQQEQERLRQERAAAWSIAEKPLLMDLKNVGLEITSVWDLVNTDKPYPEAIPVLLTHLKKKYPDRVKEGIARALAVPDAKRGWDVLLDEYTRITDESGKDAKDGLAVAISAVSDDSIMGELLQLIRDRRHGKSRILLLRGLKKSKLPEAKKALDELVNDPDLATEIRAWQHKKQHN
jgi:hypothetical protein